MTAGHWRSGPGTRGECTRRVHLDAATALAPVRYAQHHNYAAYRAHRRRRLRLLDSS